MKAQHFYLSHPYQMFETWTSSKTWDTRNCLYSWNSSRQLQQGPGQTIPVGMSQTLSVTSDDCSEFEQRVTRAKKILSADDSLDRMKQEMERQIEDQPFFKNIEESLERISSSPEYKSYEQIFKELGGSELQESQDPQSQDQQDKLENLVEDLVKTSA
ncbi:unnamed protein product, partial [Timema podura]|nr:unnamed protein product [Timema podura]